MVSSAHAQDMGAGAETGQSIISESDIVVTAQRREERLQDTPISIVALSADSLASRGVTNLKSITNFAPNVEFTSGARTSSGGSSYSAWIRGVGTGDYAFPTDPGVGIYVDGVYMARTMGGLLSVADIERIEVLRGPQGTLYGRNTMAGAVKLVTTAPKTSGDGDYMVQGRVGSYGRMDIIASVNRPLVEDKVGVKFSASYFSLDGFGRRILTGEKLRNENRIVLRGGLMFNLADDLSLDIRGDYSRQRNRGIAQHLFPVSAATPATVTRFNTIAAPVQNAQLGLPAGTTFGAQGWSLQGTYDTYGTSPIRDNYDIGGVAGTLTWSPSPELSVVLLSAWRKMKTDVWQDGDSTPYTVSYAREKIHHNQFSQEIQASGDLFGGALHYLVGAYYLGDQGRSIGLSGGFEGLYQITGLASDARTTFNLRKYKSRAYALFTQEELKLGGGVSVIGGARINWDKKEYGLEQQRPELNYALLLPYTANSRSWTSFTPKVGANWQVNPDILLYASWSKGFKSGGFSNPTATAPVVTPYDPEKLETYEAGFKTQWLERRLTLNLTGYTSKWSDIQLTVQTPGPTGGIVNVTGNGGTARLKGFEGEIVARPVDALQFNVNVGYIDNKFTKISGNVTGVTLASKLPRAPKWTISTGAQFSEELDIGRLTLRGDLSYRSSQYLNIADLTSYHKGYSLLSARVAFVPAGLDMLEFAVEGSNLTNKYYNVVQQSAASVWGPVGFEVPGEPRMINFTGTLRF